MQKLFVKTVMNNYISYHKLVNSKSLFSVHLRAVNFTNEGV